MDEVVVQEFDPRWRADFVRLNLAWLERWFAVEPIDRAVLDDPERYILEAGGVVYFARIGETVVGTCALKRHPDGSFELTKMAVDERYQGQRIGHRLLRTAIAGFKSKAGSELFLESSSKLPKALDLYARNGFELQPGTKPGSHYARSDIYMIYRELSDTGNTG